MSANDKTPDPISAVRRRVRRYRITGIIILLLGFGVAGVVYWLGTRAAELSDDRSMAGFYKAESRQMGMLYGKEGLLVEDMFNDLKQPGTQALLIVATSIVIAAGCFYFARLLAQENEIR